MNCRAKKFGERLKGLLASQFPDDTVESATISPDLEHSLSGNYVRGLSKRGSRYQAFLAVPDDESQDTVNNSLTFALLMARPPSQRQSPWNYRGRSTDCSKGNL